MKKNDYSSIYAVLEGYKTVIENKIKEELNSFGKETKLKEACSYALLNGGKRFRPAIVLMCAKALKSCNDVLDAALAVEFFHTASLIADDLPCMDNDDLRRNQPSLHKAFGEATALLASYALISFGYRLIYKNALLVKDSGKVALIALENATANTGILGATGGQFIDLYPPDHSLDTLKEVLNKKTVTLFEIAFVFGWVFGGGDLEKLCLVKEVAYHWGMAFQIADDLDDMSQDDKQKKEVNLASSIGKDKALSIFKQEISLLKNGLEDLKLATQDFLMMIDALERSAFKLMSTHSQ